MTERFAVEADSPLFEGLDDVQVIFHGINKSGSKSMAAVLRTALFQELRTHQALSHYHIKGDMPLEEFRDVVESRPGRTFAVSHYLYGFLPPRPRRIWITQFRHPLPRAVSVHQWLKNKYLKKHGTVEGFPDLTKFVRGTRLAHSQVVQFGRGFGRYGDSDLRKSLSGEVLYEIAVDALEREFFAIGIAEHFEESIFTFAALLGLSHVSPWETDMRNTDRPMVDQLTQAERDLIREVYHWDYKLYDWALARFAQQNASIKFGDSLARFKEACAGRYKDRLVGSSADDAVEARFARSQNA